MPKLNEKSAVVPQQEKKYPTRKLLNSKHLAGYQRDFARVILTETEYTIKEAITILDEVLKGGK